MEKQKNLIFPNHLERVPLVTDGSTVKLQDSQPAKNTMNLRPGGLVV